MSSIQELISTRYTELFEINKELLLIGDKYFKKFEHPSTSSCDVLMGLVSKMIRSHNAVILLVKNGYGLESSNNTRSMFEDCVNLMYVLKNRSECRAKRYMRHGNVQRYFLLEKAKNKKNFKGIFPHDDYKKLKIKKNKFWRNYKRPHKRYWSGKNLRELCKNVGFEDFYEIYYDLESHHPHSQPILIGKFIKNITSTQQTFYSGPESNKQEGYLISAFNWLHKALSISSIYFRNKPMQIELKNLYINFRRIIAKNYLK